MANYRITIDLLKLNKSKVVTLDGRKGIFIPFGFNSINPTTDEQNEIKSVIVHYIALAYKDRTNRKDSHCLKQMLTRGELERMSKEEIANNPFVGTMRVHSPKNTVSNSSKDEGTYQEYSKPKKTTAKKEKTPEKYTADNLPY